MPDPNQKAKQSPIPAKRYLTISEVSKLLGVEPHVLRYWEQEFPQLQVERRRKRRYYQQRDLLVIERIRALLRDQGFTISGARQHLQGTDVRKGETQSKLLLRQLIGELESLLQAIRV